MHATEQTQGLAHIRQALYQLSYSPSLKAGDLSERCPFAGDLSERCPVQVLEHVLLWSPEPRSQSATGEQVED